MRLAGLGGGDLPQQVNPYLRIVIEATPILPTLGLAHLN